MITLDRTLITPWATDTPELLTRTLTHVARATLTDKIGVPICTLDLEGGSVSFDETRSPRAQAMLSCRVPDDQATLDLIDPRLGVRVVIEAGYRRPDGTEDVQPLADLGVRSRTVSRPTNLLSVEALGDEAVLIDASPTSTGSITNATTTGAATAVLNQVVTPGTLTVTGSTGPAVSGVIYTDRWEVINDLLDRIGSRIYDDGLRQWFIAPAPSLGTPALALAVGHEGTIITSDTGLTRDDGWANYVWVRYEWIDASDVTRVINASRRITSGPYAAVTGENLRILRFDREVGTTQTEANAAADALVARTVTRGRSFQISAISAYWLRPGHTVDVTLPIGSPEQHLVTATEFDLRDGTMRVTTRLPDGNYTIGA